MAVIPLPAGPPARRAAPVEDHSVLPTALRGAIRGDVRFDAGSRATYSTDASNYRQVPIAVVRPADVDDAAGAVRVCREHDVPILFANPRRPTGGAAVTSPRGAGREHPSRDRPRRPCRS